jgi:hypothetical protein
MSKANDNHPKPLYLAFLSSLIGMGGTLLVSPLQHPFDVMKVNWQTNPHLKHELAVVRMIGNSKGRKGFYSGYLTNCTKQVFKSSYRYPLISGLPRFYAHLFGSNYEKKKYQMKFLTALTVSLVEAGLITPFERLQVFIMTSQSTKKNYADFYQMIKSNIGKELFKGYTPYLVRQVTAWTVLLQSDAYYKTKIRKFYNIRDDEMVTGWKLLLCTIMVSATTIICAMPFDNIKTFLQKHTLEMRPDGETGNKIEKVNIKSAIKSIYARGGPFGFFVGWRLKSCSYFITTSLAVTLIERLDNLNKDSYK